MQLLLQAKLESFFNDTGAAAGGLDLQGEYSWIESIPTDPSKFRFDLDVYVPNPDDYIIAPERVWRDDVFTYLDFGDKSINMLQRPVVSLLIERGESPVGFRTTGPQGRLMIVEAVGDLVLRNGQRIVCIKKREQPYMFENAQMASDFAYEMGMAQQGGMMMADGTGTSGYPEGTFIPGNEYVQQGMNMTGQNMMAAQQSMTPMTAQQPMMNMGSSSGYTGMNPLYATNRYDTKTNASVLSDHNVPLVKTQINRVAIELHTPATGQFAAANQSVKKLEEFWQTLLQENDDLLAEFMPFYAVEEKGVDELGAEPFHGAETYRLRIGPVENVKQGDELCQKLSERGVSCSVVRTQ